MLKAMLKFMLKFNAIRIDGVKYLYIIIRMLDWTDCIYKKKMENVYAHGIHF